jgi:hypothetical protein
MNTDLMHTNLTKGFPETNGIIPVPNFFTAAILPTTGSYPNPLTFREHIFRA